MDMFKITEKRVLAPNIYLYDIEAPRVARSAQPGQFIILRVNEKGERIPLTITDYDTTKGTVTIVVQVVGASTKMIAGHEKGDSFLDFVGPLGRPSEFIHFSPEKLKEQKILFVAGGVGTAPVYPQVKWLSMNGIRPDVIIGAKTSEFLIMTEEMKQVAGEVFIATDDGTAGFKGMVTNLLEDLVVNQKRSYNHIIAIGPMIMMKFVSMLTQKLNIHTTVSLNTLMVDGTGMCGACRVSVGNKTYFTCVDGPEFDGHLVNFDEAMRRQVMYKTIEDRKAKQHDEDGFKCPVGLS